MKELTICVQAQVVEKIVSVGLADISHVQIERKEGNESPRGNLPVKFVDERLWSPSIRNNPQENITLYCRTLCMHGEH